MKKRLLTFMAVSLFLGTNLLLAAYTKPESGKVYRIHNVKYGKVMGENAIARELTSVEATSEDDFKQLWLLQEKATGYTLQNAYSGQYLQHCAQQSTQVYPTGDTEATIYLTQISEATYAIGQTTGAYLHLDAGNNIVRWWDKNTEPSQWQFEEVSVSSEAVSLQQAAFKELYDNFQFKLGLMEHLDEYNALLPTFFADTACTVLKDTYAAMSDDELRTAMNALPTSLQDIAIKVKAQSWGHREEEFRIRNYKAYSDPDYWAEVLYTKKYSRINNPTGIYGNAGDVLYVFVGNNVPEGATLTAEVISGSGIQGEATTLKPGLNMIPTMKDYSNLFIRYVGKTSMESDVLITDYPALKIHVEEGVVNGFWNIEEHNDEDWVDMLTNMATADVFQVKGERMMFHMSRKYLSMYCPNTITDAIGWWDDMTRWQQDMLGIEDVRLTKFNNLGCAISLTSGYQSATHYRTQYLDSYIGNLLPYENMMSNADNCWGPAHENGHVHQAAIQSVGTSEVSNNFFSNLTLNKLGRYISRGSANDVIFTDYANHKPYILRDGASTMRSFWQLYLYFHEAKVDTTFYPRVLQAMRATPMKARDPQYYANYVYGNEDLLLFAKACCDVAQLDLSEFFRFWGYLEITDKQHIGDYGDFYLTTRQSDVDEFLAHAAQYPKAPSIIFIEDRVNPIPRTDGGQGNKLHHGTAVRVGEAGDVGHYTDFMDTSVKAEGYIYRKDGTKITITKGTGALGFKVYTKHDGALVYGSNHLEFNIPKEYTMRDLIIVAAQADGTDVPIQSLVEVGTESEQLEFLNEALALAKEYAEKTDSTGKIIGAFYPDSVIALNELIKQAEQAIQNEDQTNNTYGSLAIKLNSTINNLHHSSTARIPLITDCFYSFATSSSNRYADHTNSKLKTSLLEEATQAQQWKFIVADTENTYYIQHRTTGNYITSVAKGKPVMAESTDIAEAVAFRLVANVPGEFFIQHANNEQLNIYNVTQIHQVYAGNQTSAQAKWVIRMEDDLLSMPEVSTDEELIIYHIVRADNREFAYSKSGRSDKGVLASQTPKKNDDFAYWFYFLQGSEEDKYAIYNYQTGMPVTVADSTLWTNKKAETAPEFTIALNADKSGMLISAEKGIWYVDIYDKYTYLSTMDTTLWRLQQVRTISLIDEPLTSLIIDQTTATLTEGDSIRLTVETAPIFATNHSVTWTSSNTSVAIVDSTGMVKALAEGIATITATANDGSEKQTSCELTVKKADTGISSTESTTVSVQSQGSIITIEGLPKGAAVRVYNVVGALIAFTEADGSKLSIDTTLEEGNIVIVKAGEHCFKLQIK